MAKSHTGKTAIASLVRTKSATTMSLYTYCAATLLLATTLVNFVLVTPNKNNNDAPLRVFMVPHSHDDVGWVDDMDTMYNSTRPGNNTIKNIYKFNYKFFT